MTETPEEVREKVFQAELAKGSDPRVAEGRAKAAEMRARHGLPTDPQEAWKAKLAGEGKTPTPAAPSAEAPAPEPPPAQAPAPAPEAEAEAQPEPSPPTAEPAAAAQPPNAAPPPPAAPSEPEPAFEPEVGEIIELDTEGLKEIAGVKLRERRPAPWMVLVLLAIVVWAGFYLIAFGNNNTTAQTSNCRIQATKTLICSQPSP